MDFPQRLRAAREDADLTQKQLAEYLGIKQQQYSAYETGQNEMPVRYLKKVCEATNLSADWILGLPNNLNYPN